MTPVKYQPADWYELPLYYDVVFDDASTAEEADFLEQVVRLHGRAASRTLFEPGCGSGRLLVEMARRGYAVTGLDRSEEMVRFAREKLAEEGLATRVDVADMARFRFDRSFDAAFCFLSTFNLLLTERAARAHLRSVRDALRPGGIYVVGIYLSDYEETARSRERYVGRRGAVKVTCNVQSWPAERSERLSRCRSRFIVEEAAEVLRFETHWWMRSYDADEVRSMLRAIDGFEHVATYDYLYDTKRPRDLDDEHLDMVLVLRRSDS